jgi:hypothetical protein
MLVWRLLLLRFPQRLHYSGTASVVVFDDMSIDPIQLDERKMLRRSNSIPKRCPLTSATKTPSKRLGSRFCSWSYHIIIHVVSNWDRSPRNVSSMVSESSSVLLSGRRWERCEHLRSRTQEAVGLSCGYSRFSCHYRRCTM